MITDRLITVILIALMLSTAAVIGYIIYDSATAVYISIRKDEFTCTASHKMTTFVMSGKIMIPLTRVVCDVYNRD